MVSCKIVTGTNRKWTLIISAYLTPSTLEHLMELEEDLECFRDHDPIVLWDLSAIISQA